MAHCGAGSRPGHDRRAVSAGTGRPAVLAAGLPDAAGSFYHRRDDDTDTTGRARNRRSDNSRPGAEPAIHTSARAAAVHSWPATIHSGPAPVRSRSTTAATAAPGSTAAV